MLKVVGASWLQTRISTYILLAVALLGIGAIILGEFGHVEKDGTYSATVSWNHKGGYRIDFWGQGNDLASIPLNAARAYYKTGIFDNGWSIIEIETSVKYPDTVQAYAAGLLEGSLTWQLIHHHWYNTVNVICEKRPVECQQSRRHLRENAAVIRERAELLESTDSFWHMVRLFYAQLDGLEAGWRFAVRRSRQSAELQSEDFLWLAMASDLPDVDSTINGSNLSIGERGMIFLKALSRKNMEPLLAIGHNTGAPYAKMLRLLKRYKFNYHVFPVAKTAAPRIPSRSIVMSSYPGALSSFDEFYLITAENRELVLAGTPLSVTARSPWDIVNPEDQVMSPVRIMAANRLATDARSWSRILAFHNSGTSMRQWVVLEPRISNIWFVEQLASITHAADYSKEFSETGALLCTGLPHFQEIKEAAGPFNEEDLLTRQHLMRLQENVTTMDHVRKFMRGYSQEESTLGSYDQNSSQNSSQNLSQNSSYIRTYRGDLEEEQPLPIGIIDTKILAADTTGIEILEATCGPSKLGHHDSSIFEWSKTFPNVSHMGQPDSFNFESVTPLWIWV